MSENGEIYTTGNKFYTPAGTDGMDKFHLCKGGKSKKFLWAYLLLTYFFPYKGVGVSHTVRWSCLNEETILDFGGKKYGGDYILPASLKKPF